MENQIMEKYPLVLEMVNRGTSVKKAIPEVGIPRSSFYKYRYVAEMKIVDPAHYIYLKDQLRYVQQRV
jgi:ACT domain-containing protein